jgi:hypothetical protein
MYSMATTPKLMKFGLAVLQNVEESTWFLYHFYMKVVFYATNGIKPYYLSQRLMADNNLHTAL